MSAAKRIKEFDQQVATGVVEKLRWISVVARAVENRMNK